MIDIDKIEQDALAATQGEWVVSDHIYAADGKRVASYYMLSRDDDQNEANATHIAQANPSAVLELITRLRAAEKDAARYHWLRNPDQDVGNVIDKRIGTPHDITGVWEYRAGDELDNAIDDAMKEKA